MQFDPVGDRHPSPSDRLLVIHFGGAGPPCQEDRGQRLRDPSLERIAGRVAHFILDAFQRRAFALPQLDGEQLQEMPLVVRGRSSNAVGTVHQVIRHVKSHGTRRGCRARRCVRRSNAGGVDEG